MDGGASGIALPEALFRVGSGKIDCEPERVGLNGGFQTRCGARSSRCSSARWWAALPQRGASTFQAFAHTPVGEAGFVAQRQHRGPSFIPSSQFGFSGSSYGIVPLPKPHPFAQGQLILTRFAHRLHPGRYF